MDDNKKPGPRDISDLKARLGLKKTGVMPAVTPIPAPPGVTPPPGTPAAGFGGAPNAIPAPFRGAEPAPPPPDPRRDPFASAQQAQQAANLAAFYGIGQTLPGSTEGVAANVPKPRPWGTIAALGGIVLVVFGIGDACGHISVGRAGYNETIDQAGLIRAEVDQMARRLTSVTDTITASRATLQGNIDVDMSVKLGQLDLKKPDTNKIFHVNHEHLEGVAIDRLFTYYNHTIRLYDEIAQHAKKTENDKEALQRYLSSGSASKSDRNYGVVAEPQGGLLLAKFVEVGAPVCADPNKTDCNAAELRGFRYRLDAGSGWLERPIKGKPTEIVMPMQQTPFFKGVAAGNPDFLAVKDYARRLTEIRALIATISTEQKDVIGDLKRAAERPKVFTL